jgi:hypothetical protein
MLVIADQVRAGIGRQGGLAGAADRPKKIAQTPSSPALFTEQCIGMMPFSGRK